MNKYAVVIIGAGPGGLACAKKLAEGGKSVLVIEKSDRIGDKICAGGVTAKEIGNIIPESLIERSFNSGLVHFGETQKPVRVTLPRKGLGVLDRRKLGEYMFSEVQKVGVEIITGRSVTEIAHEYIVDEKGEKYCFDFLVGADGSKSIVRKHLKLPTQKIGMAIQYTTDQKFDDAQVFCDFKRFGPLYIWVFPHKTYTQIGTASFHGLIPYSEVKKSFESWLHSKNIDISKAELHQFPINSDYQGFQFENMFLIGDAAGLADALTGEGIYPAIISGQEAARKIITPDYSMDKLQTLVSQKRKRERVFDIYMKYNWFFKKFGNSLGAYLFRLKKVQTNSIHEFLY